MTLSNGWISISVRRVRGPAGKRRFPRMLPELTIARSVPASARSASATRLPRFVSEVRRWLLTPSSGTREVATTLSSLSAEPAFVGCDHRLVRGSSGIALVIGSSSKKRSIVPLPRRLTSIRATVFASDPALLISARFSVAVIRKCS